MAKRYVGEIVISRRVVQIGHEVYPLANISRVQTVQVVWRGRLATLYPLKPLLVLVIAVAAIRAGIQLIPPRLPPDVPLDVVETARQAADAVSWVAGVAALCAVTVLCYRMFVRKPRYALLLETSGTQYTALSGTDLAEIKRIRNIIVGAIENPPVQPTSVQVHGDVVVGDKVGRDQFKWSGNGNRSFT